MAGSPLIALPPDPASPPNATVAGDGWWPAIDRNAARDALRLGEIVTDARLVSALEGAWLTVTSDLAEWAMQIQTGWPNATPPIAGAANLAAVTVEQLSALSAPNQHRRPWFDPVYGAYGWGEHSRSWSLRYTPARAAWLAGTLMDSVTGIAVPRLVVLFTRAVRFVAAAELADSYRSIGMTNKADIRAEAELATGADYRRIALEAVRDMLGQTRVTSVLI